MIPMNIYSAVMANEMNKWTNAHTNDTKQKKIIQKKKNNLNDPSLYQIS